MGRLRPSVGPVGAEESPDRDPALVGLERGHRADQPQDRDRPAGSLQGRAIVGHLAEVDRLDLGQGLLDGRVAEGLRAELVVPAAIGAEELHGAGQPVVQARPSLLDPQGDIEVGEPHDQRQDHPTDRQPGPQDDHADQQDQAEFRGEMDQPVGQAGDQDRRRQPEGQTAQAVERQEPTNLAA